jgi:antitoxin component YwqK of YwqJK toxin-antitoxin module
MLSEMKLTNRFLLLSVFLLTTAISWAQMDTLTFEPHSVGMKGEGKKCQYYVDGKLSTKEKYLKVTNDTSKSVERCKPCWLRVNDKDGKLNYEGNYWTDCCIGAYIQYYNTGQIKTKGQYKTPGKGQNPTCKQEGLWLYYKGNGNIEKTETYKDGQLVK